MSSSNSHGRIPLLNGDNYITWKAQMEAILHRGRFLQYVKGKILRPETAGVEQAQWEDKDMDARAELLIAMEANIVALAANLKTSKEVCDFLADCYDKKGPRQKTEEYRKLTSLEMNAGQSITEYVREFKTITNRLKELGATLDEDLLVVVLLDGLSEDYRDIRSAFDAQSAYPEVSTVCTRLLEVGDRKKEPINNNVFSAKHFKPQKHQKKPSNYKVKSDTNVFPYNCRKCGKRGHMAKDCWSKGGKIRQAQSGFDDECGFVLQECSSESVNVTRESNQEKLWCLDSGATSHMCAEKSKFVTISKTDRQSHVKLADNHLVEVTGIGTVKSGIRVSNGTEPFYLYDTLYVPKLTDNLISISKATNQGYKIIFEGAKILDKTNRLMMKAKKGMDYIFAQR